jgi:hypothetical protein
MSTSSSIKNNNGGYNYLNGSGSNSVIGNLFPSVLNRNNGANTNGHTGNGNGGTFSSNHGGGGGQTNFDNKSPFSSDACDSFEVSVLFITSSSSS